MSSILILNYNCNFLSYFQTPWYWSIVYFLTAKDVPFRVRFVSDNWEYNNAGATAADEGGSTGVDDQAGFKLR